VVCRFDREVKGLSKQRKRVYYLRDCNGCGADFFRTLALRNPLGKVVDEYGLRTANRQLLMRPIASSEEHKVVSKWSDSIELMWYHWGIEGAFPRCWLL